MIMKAPTLETERLTLRPFQDADVEPFVDAVFSNLNVMKTLPQDPQTFEEQTACAKQYIDTYTSEWPEHGYGGWAVFSRSNAITPKSILLGFCGFELGKRDGGIAEIGFGYSQSCWGKGVGYEAALAAVDWFFGQGGFEEFYACYDPINVGSKRILEKLGMVHVGDEDLWDSVEKGLGLIPVYVLARDKYLTQLQQR
jgi:RimJ/RimL family protein N-acetyltransferase